MSKKTTSSSAPTNAAAASATTEAVVHSEQAGAATPPGSADTSSTDNPQSKATAGGAGDGASPAGTAEAIAKALVEEAGCADPQHLIVMAKLGVRVFDYLDEASLRDGPLKDFPLHDDPFGMLPYLFEMVVSLENKLAFSEVPAEAEGKRGFILLKAVRIDNELTEMHKPVWLEREQHAELAAAEAVDPDWDKGVQA